MEMDTDTDGERGMARRQGLSEEALDSIEKRYSTFLRPFPFLQSNGKGLSGACA